jgi:hypothetical protein
MLNDVKSRDNTRNGHVKKNVEASLNVVTYRTRHNRQMGTEFNKIIMKTGPHSRNTPVTAETRRYFHAVGRGLKKLCIKHTLKCT